MNNIISLFFYIYLWFDYYYDDTLLSKLKLALAILSTPTILYDFYIIVKTRSWILLYLIGCTIDFLFPSLREHLYNKKYGFYNYNLDNSFWTTIKIKLFLFFIHSDNGSMNIYIGKRFNCIINDFSKLNNNEIFTIKGIKPDIIDYDKDSNRINLKMETRFYTYNIIDDKDDGMVKLHKNWKEKEINKYWEVEIDDEINNFNITINKIELRFYAFVIIENDKIIYFNNDIENTEINDLYDSRLRLFKCEKIICNLKFKRCIVG